MLYFFIRSLAKALLPSIWAAPLLGPKIFKTLFLKKVYDPHAEGHLRPHHGQIDLRILRKAGQALQIGRGDIKTPGLAGDAAVAGRAIDLLNPGALGDLPDQGVFPAAAADDEDLHTWPIP